MGHAYADVAVIVHLSNGSSLDAQDVKRIFLAQRKVFPGVGKVVPIDQPEGALSQEIFAKIILQKSSKNIRAYWSALIFTGQGSSPVTKVDNEDIKQYVASSPESIGYVDSVSVDDTVKVLLTL